MPVQKIISTLHKLGMEMSNSARLKNEAFRNAENANPWFTEKEILRMVDHIVNNYLNTEITAEGQLSQLNKTRVKDIYSYDSGFIDFVLGGRWYQSLNTSSKIFLGAGLGVNSPFGNTFQKRVLTVATTPDFIFTEGFIYSVDASIYLDLQAGYQFSNHYGINLIYDTKKTSFLAGGEEKYSNFSRFGLNLRYTF